LARPGRQMAHALLVRLGEAQGQDGTRGGHSEATQSVACIRSKKRSKGRNVDVLARGRTAARPFAQLADAGTMMLFTVRSSRECTHGTGPIAGGRCYCVLPTRARVGR
jgi:hypothetical protein